MRTLFMVPVAAAMLSLPAFAEDEPYRGALVGQEIDVSYEASRARLVAVGYDQVAPLNGDALHLSAVDPQGQEVVLSVNPQTGEIEPAE